LQTLTQHRFERIGGRLRTGFVCGGDAVRTTPIVAVLITVALSCVEAQWVNYRDPAIPRSRDGRPAWFALGISLGALVYLFLCNGGPRGSHFLYRYFPLSVVVGWKFVAASLVALPALKILPSASPNLSGWSLSATMAVLNLVMFYRIGHHLKRLARET
jgi:hypothetical protein